VVTGASSGIGRGVAERAARLGAHLVLAARRAEALEELADQLRRSGGQALVVPTDVSQPGAAETLADAAERRFGPIDLWFNNAGIAPIGRFWDIPASEHARTVEVNLNGVLYGSHAALRRFRAQGRGTLANMASVEGVVPLAYHASYAATKHAIIGLGGALREELRLARLRRIRLLSILPWAVDTPFWTNAANHTGRPARGPMPEDARAVAAAVLHALRFAPSSDVPIGFRAGAAVLGGRLAPRLSTRLAAAVIERVQMRPPPGAPVTAGNLFAPSPSPATVRRR
jgi:short-subunit dehydrogenase